MMKLRHQLCNFLNKFIVDKLEISGSIKDYIKNLPDSDTHLYIGPLIVFQQLTNDNIEEIDDKLIGMLLSNKFEEISEAVSLFKLGIYHNIIFEKAQECIEGIIENKTFDLKVRVEAASVFPHLFEFQKQQPSKDFMKILLALIPEDENMIELANEPSINRLHRF